jgi:hypothetical protein
VRLTPAVTAWKVGDVRAWILAREQESNKEVA